MKHMKKLVCLTLVAISLFAVMAPAFALTGTVVGGMLRMRGSAKTDGTIIAYMKNGTSVTVLDGGSITNGFYHITAESYTDSACTKNKDNRTGYGMASYIE